MSSINVWNHSSSRQKRPLLFTAPLGASLSNYLLVGQEQLLAAKQYDDGVDAVYMCQPPALGWATGLSPLPNHAITAYSGSDPQLRFQFHPVFGLDSCGVNMDLDLRFLPELWIFRETADTVPSKTLRLTNILPWSAGPHPDTGVAIPNGGSIRRYFSCSAHDDGWHLYFHIWIDSNSAVCEFAAEVLRSAHHANGSIAAENPGTPDNSVDWFRTRCDRVELRWQPTVHCKPKFNTEGITQVAGDNVFVMSTTFADADSSNSSSNYRYGNWNGVWVDHTGWVMRGFMLLDNSDATNNEDQDAIYAAAGPLYACLDAETWDGHWFGGGSSGHGIEFVNIQSGSTNTPIPQVAPRWDITTAHFQTWDRGAAASDTNGAIGMVNMASINATGSQGNLDGFYGHSMLLGVNSPRDYEAASADCAKRPHFVWADGHTDINAAVGVHLTERGRIDPDHYVQRSMPSNTAIACERGRPRHGNFWMGRPQEAAVNFNHIGAGGANVTPGWDINHACNPSPPAAYRILKDPMVHQMISWFMNGVMELGVFRPGNSTTTLGGSSGSRGTGRVFTTLTAIWQACPGIRYRVLKVVYHNTRGFYNAMEAGQNHAIKYRFKAELADLSPPHITTALGPSNITNPNYSVNFIRPEESAANEQEDHHWRFIPGGTEAANSTYSRYFRGQSVTWTLIGAAGLLTWYSAMLRDNRAGNQTVAVTHPPVTDFADWGQTVMEAMMDWGMERCYRVGKWMWIPVYAYQVYRGFHMPQTSTMATFYPPTTGPHPFLDTVGSGGTTAEHPMRQYFVDPSTNSSNLLSWTLCAFNWYRHYGRTASYRARAQETFGNLLEWQAGGGAGAREKYAGWQQVFPASTAPLLPMTAPNP